LRFNFIVPAKNDDSEMIHEPKCFRARSNPACSDTATSSCSLSFA
jgi:hypothetical protein